jgi:iron-sulfur cluster repair protein YtfE (RIC family)
VALTLRRLLETLDRFRTRHRRQLAFLAPAVERRRPRLAAEDYAARHSIEHTLDRKAELRRLAPTLPSAARRYHQLLTYELEGLREMVSALHSVAGDRELEECLAETGLQMERLEIEIAWCNHLLGNAAETVAVPG